MLIVLSQFIAALNLPHDSKDWLIIAKELLDETE
jgi:hypothetical protein|tara:strand:+ start:2460 stop:2561 length:102 start_codon:yes stop_codon:yes gene_type:complete